MWIDLDRNAAAPLVTQLYGAIRSQILDGTLAPGRRLPASRHLAASLRISRNVALEAYDLLLAEGFVTARRGSGTFVAAGATFPGAGEKPPPPAVAPLHMGYDSPPGVINFRPGTPDLGMFPSRLWLAMVREVLALPPQKTLAYDHPEGRGELRQAICDAVVARRQVVCHPEQVVITGGTTQAINIVCRLLLGQRREVIIEDPITRDIRSIIASHGGRLHPLAVDGEGLRTELLPEHLAPAFVYTTPSHQFPCGAVMPIQRRIELLNYATRSGAYLVEDDYDSEFRYEGPPLGALHGLHPERVVYIGTFSKTLSPALRLGYLILPASLVEQGRSHKWHSDLHNEVISQLALARFIDQGHYLRHLRRMRAHYRQRRDETVATLTDLFGDEVDILGSSAGLHLVARFPGRTFTGEFFAAMEKRGVRLYAVAAHAIDPETRQDELLLGYGNLDPTDIRRGLERLADSLRARQRQGDR